MKRKFIHECVAQYPLEAASELDDKVTEHSFDLKSTSEVDRGALPETENLPPMSGSILSLQPTWTHLR